MIRTARLVLRPPTHDDLAWRLAALNTAAVTRHLGGVRAADDVAAGLERDIAGFAADGCGFWTIWHAADDVRAGKCGLGPIHSDHAPAQLQGQPQIGWSLAVGFWGRGIAAEAARAVLAHGFTQLGHDAIWSQTSGSNAASTRLMDRLGFVACPQLDYVDPDYPAEDNPTTVYRLDRAAWTAAA